MELDYLKKEQKMYVKLEKSGLTIDQIAAIENMIEFKLEYLHEYRNQNLKDEMKIIAIKIRNHKHIDGSVCLPFEG